MAKEIPSEVLPESYWKILALLIHITDFIVENRKLNNCFMLVNVGIIFCIFCYSFVSENSGYFCGTTFFFKLFWLLTGSPRWKER